VNHWEGDSYMVSVEDSNLKHGGFILKQSIWNAARDTLSEWTGQQMAECSLYGIRVYKEGAVLAPREFSFECMISVSILFCQMLLTFP